MILMWLQPAPVLYNKDFFPAVQVPPAHLFKMAEMETIASFNSPVVFLNSSISDSFPKFINFRTPKNNVSHFSIKVTKNGTVMALVNGTVKYDIESHESDVLEVKPTADNPKRRQHGKPFRK